jgi:uncharacterized membrane protein YsdA (DUF1294 family)/cold shock CspA family protein
MLLEGELRRWDDAKGYGFIRVGTGQPDVFVHISAFAVGTRPKVGDRIIYGQVTLDKGKPRAGEAVVKGSAADTSPYRQARPSSPPTRGSAPRGRPPRDTRTRPLRPTPALFAVALLTLGCLASALSFLRVSPLPLLAYPLASLSAFILYGHDKIRAIRGEWRVPEALLHLVELAGGWPGAWVAQQMMRHKTVKASYQAGYWFIVSLHVVFWGLWWLLPETRFNDLFAPMLGAFDGAVR